MLKAVSREAPPKRDYHHRDLKRALAAAAYAIIRDEGQGAFTWAEACARVGVSIAAPYRHYPDKRGLFSAVALIAFDDLIVSLSAARAAAGDDRRERVLSVVEGYLDFARRSPHLLTLLFGPDVDFAPQGPLADAGQRAIAPLIADIAALAPDRTADEAAACARNIWLVLHGAAILAINGQLRMPNGDWIDNAQVRSAVTVLLADAMPPSPAARA